jgi:hypothetical protein
MGKVVALLQRQRVHVGPQRDRRAFADAQGAHHPRSSEAAMHGEPEARQALRNEGRGFVLFECSLRVGMQMPPP